MLLDEDGLNAAWERGIDVSDYLGELGQHDAHDAGLHVPLVFARANNPRLYDPSGMGAGQDAAYVSGMAEQRGDPTDTTPVSEGDVRVVKNMSMFDFRRRLIEHFNILWRQGKVKWPSRTGVVEWAS